MQALTKKIIRFLPSLSFFFITGNGFQRFVGQTSITLIFFKYTVCGKKGKKKKKKKKKNQATPVIEIAPQISSPGYGPDVACWICTRTVTTHISSTDVVLQ